MRRRTLLAATGAGLGGAGFWSVSKRSLEENYYVTCEAAYVPYDRLPDDAAAEVDAALEDGAYDTRGKLYYERAVADGVVLWKGEDYYVHRIDDDGDATTLSFEAVSPSRPSPAELRLSNAEADPLSVRVTVERDGETVTDEELTVDPAAEGDDLPTVAFAEAFGEYDVTVDVEDGEKLYTRVGLSVDPAFADALLVVSRDDVDIERNVDEAARSPCSGGWWGEE
ncbi:hypothetical protein [Salinilacihabitans rarus]|uniref:hypothetical protein n=1 Tax=Salinilacihabitans rarus TaxID=2961596 RepID=UPI0020C86EEE|nr:hypothetical protein [Salinilacihabitans rarus]